MRFSLTKNNHHTKIIGNLESVRVYFSKNYIYSHIVDLNIISDKCKGPIEA